MTCPLAAKSCGARSIVAADCPWRAHDKDPGRPCQSANSWENIGLPQMRAGKLASSLHKLLILCRILPHHRSCLPLPHSTAAACWTVSLTSMRRSRRTWMRATSTICHLKNLVGYLARKKAEAVSINARDALIIGADQIAVPDDGHVLGKPGDHQRAVEQLLAASGKSVTFLTAVCILDPVGRTRHEHVDKTTVRFRQFDRRLAEVYLRHDEPYDCAGSFQN